MTAAPKRRRLGGGDDPSQRILVSSVIEKNRICDGLELCLQT